MRKRKTKKSTSFFPKEKNEGNLFDKIFKENSEATFVGLAARRLGIKIASYRPLPEKTQTTLEREADLLIIVETDSGKEFILHIEFQAKNNNEMVYRNGEYHGIELRKYKLPIKHVVIYLGKDKPKMRTQLREEEIYTGFELIIVNELDALSLLTSQMPEDIILAVLAHFDENRTEAIIRLLLKNLKAACKNENDLRKYINQLKVYGKLRNLDTLIHKIVETMPITYDITKDSFYMQGIEKGIEKGMEKLEEKVEEKVDEVKIQAIKNMLERDFEIKTISEILQVTQKYVKKIQKEMK